VPPIIVNVPPASGPPWWATVLIAFVSAILGILVTAYIARGREHQKWLWEKRFQAMTEIRELAQDVRDWILESRDSRRPLGWKEEDLAKIAEYKTTLSEPVYSLSAIVGVQVITELALLGGYLAARERSLIDGSAIDPSAIETSHEDMLFAVEKLFKSTYDAIVTPPPLLRLRSGPPWDLTGRRAPTY
jgi:hypothetical protein